jgi:cell division protein FtsZ
VLCSPHSANSSKKKYYFEKKDSFLELHPEVSLLYGEKSVEVVPMKGLFDGTLLEDLGVPANRNEISSRSFTLS